MAALIGALRVSLSADTAHFDAGMKRAQRQASASSAAIGKSLGTLKAGVAGFAAAFSVGLLSAGIKSALDYAGSLGEVSQQLGVTTKDLQVLRFAAGQAGIGQEELDKSLLKLRVTMGQVAAGAQAPTKALAAIGLTAKDLAGLDTGTALRKIADGLSKVRDSSQRAAIEVALFGKTGAKLDTILAGGSKGINELSLAAEKLGVVLSDSQIQSADETADKLDAVKTVLAAQISGVVADNAGSILTLAGALASLTSSIVSFLGSNPMGALAILGAIAGSRFGIVGAAGGAFAGATAGARMGSANAEADLTGKNRSSALLKNNFLSEAKKLRQIRKQGKPFGDQLARVRRLKQKYDSATGVTPAIGNIAPDIGQFLASGGGGGKAKPKGGGKDRSAEKAERARLDAIRDAYRFDEDTRRADMDILRAKQSLATDLVERTALSIQMLNLERASFEAGLQNDVAMGDMTEAQAAILRARYVIKDGLERQAVLAEEEEQRQRNYEMLEQKTFEVSQGILEKRAGLAETTSERRAIELEILKLAYEEKRRALQHIIDTSKDWAEQEAARRDLAALGTNERLDRQGVMNSTRGPLEGYIATLPTDAAKLNEAMEQVAVGGLQSIQDGLLAVVTGTESLGSAFKKMAASIVADLIKIAIQRAIVGALGKALGGFGGLFGGGMSAGAGGLNPAFLGGGSLTSTIPKFARGGAFTIMGRSGVDRNVMSINSLPIAQVSKGERVNISNDNANASGGGRQYFDLRGAVMTHDLMRQMNEIGQVSTAQGAMLGAASGQQATMRQQRRQIP